MPRYFLHIRNSPQRLEDLEGSELPDAAAAQEEAVGSAVDLICDRLKDGWFQSDRKISAAASRSPMKVARWFTHSLLAMSSRMANTGTLSPAHGYFATGPHRFDFKPDF